MEYHALTRVRVCPYCGSRSLVLDYARGVLVCRNCGAVVDETIVDYGGLEVAARRQAGRAFKRFADKTLSIVDENRIASRYAGLKLHVKLYEKIADSSKAAEYISTLAANDLRTLAGNKCLWELMSKLTSSEKLVAIEAFRTLLSGEEPLQAVLASEFSVPRRRVKSIVKAVRMCLGLPDPSRLL